MRRGFDDENSKRRFHAFPATRASRASVPSYTSSRNTSFSGSSGSYNNGYQTPARSVSPCPVRNGQCPIPTANGYSGQSLSPRLSYGTPNSVAFCQRLSTDEIPPYGGVTFARTASFCGVPGSQPQYHPTQHYDMTMNEDKYGDNSGFCTPRNSINGMYQMECEMAIDCSGPVCGRPMRSPRSMPSHRV